MAFTRRHLPHIHYPGHPVFVTFRLHGSLLPGRAFHESSVGSGRAFVCMDRLLHACRCGPMHFNNPKLAGILATSLASFAGHEMELHEWVIMPNHAHILATPHGDLSALMTRIKGRSARRINGEMGLTGQPFWQAESYDRLVRNVEEFRRIARYIVMNPVQAGLTSSPEEYRWSSAGGLKPFAG